MSLTDNKKIIQETYDRGEFCGLSFDGNKIGLAVKNKKHWDVVNLKSELPKKEFEDLQAFVSELGKPKKASKALETT